MKRLTCYALVLVCVVGLAVLAQGTNVLTLGKSEELTTLDPQNHFNRTCFMLYRLVYGGMTEIMPGGGVIPRLATSWEASDNATVWTFHLRQGVAFHNGEPFNADAVKYSFDRLINNPELIHHRYVTDLLEVKVIDEYTVSFHLAKPNAEYPYYVSSMSGVILPPAYSEEHSVNGKLEWPMDQIGTGPFKYVDWDSGTGFRVVRNPDFWGWGTFATTNVDEIVYIQIKETSTKIAALEAGEVDVIDGVPVESIASINSNPNLTVVQDVRWQRFAIWMQTENGIFDDPLVRRAMQYSVDREELAEYVYGMGRATYSYIPEGMPGSNPYLVPFGYNPELARELLAQAGYPDGLDLDYITCETWYPKQAEAAAALQQQMAAAGIRLNVRLLDGGPFRAARADKDWDLMYTADVFEGIPGLRLSILGQGTYYSGWDYTFFNKLLALAVAETDADERARIFMLLNSYMHEQGDCITVVLHDSIDAINDRVVGFQPCEWWDWYLYEVQLQ